MASGCLIKNDKKMTKSFQNNYKKWQKDDTCAIKMTAYGHTNMHVEYIQVSWLSTWVIEFFK